MKTSRGDVQALRGLLILVAALTVITLATGIVGIGFSPDDGIEAVRDDGGPTIGGSTMAVTVQPDEAGAETVGSFAPTSVQGRVGIDGAARVLHLIGGGLVIVGVLAAAVLFFAILTDAANDDPFIRRNVGRWHWVAAAFLICLFGSVVDAFAAMEAKSAAGLDLSADLNLTWAPAALAAGAMARIWDAGVGLREEQELTI